MEKITVDEGKAFDFGKTSKAYAKYRDIYPEDVFEKLYEIGVGVQGSRWLDLGTGTGVIPRGLAKYGADIVATDISEQQITEASRSRKIIPISNMKFWHRKIFLIRNTVLMLLLHASVSGILIRILLCLLSSRC